MAQDILDKIRAAAQEKGVDPDVAVRISSVESSLAPGVKNPRSTAGGLFQIIDDTWRRYGGAPGKKLDVDENIRVGTDILADNVARLSKGLGRAPSGAELYAAHFFGPEKALQVLSASADQPMSSVVSKAVLRANPDLRNRTVGEVLAGMERKMAPVQAAAPVSQPVAAVPPAAAAGAPGAGYAAPVKQTPVQPGPDAQRAARLAELGPNYQAALAVALLADEKDEADRERLGPSEAEKFLMEPPSAARRQLAALDLGYRSPFPRMMAKGGFAEGGSAGSYETPKEDLEMLEASRPSFRMPSSGKGRQYGPISQALDTGEGQVAFLKGMTNLPQNVVGVPVDISNLLLSAVGMSSKEPVGGSEWLKRKTQEAGMGFTPPQDETLRKFYGAGDIASGLVNPAAVTRGAVKAVGKTGEAAKMMAQLARQDPAVAAAVGRTVERVAPAAQPVYAVAPQLEQAVHPALVPTADQPFVGRLDQHVAGLTSTMQKQQFLNSLKGKFRDYDLARAEDALADLAPTDKIQPAQIMERLQGSFSPRNFSTVIHEPKEGMFFQGMDNVYFDNAKHQGLPLGVVNLRMDVPPAIAAKQNEAKRASNAIEGAFRSTQESLPAGEIDFLSQYLTSEVGMPAEQVGRVVGMLQQAEDMGARVRAIKASRYDLKHPILSSQYDSVKRGFEQQLLQQQGLPPTAWYKVSDQASAMAKQVVQENALNQLKGFFPEEQLSAWAREIPETREVPKSIVQNVETLERKLSDDFDQLWPMLRGSGYRRAGAPVTEQSLADEAYALAAEGIKNRLAYTGQHVGLKGGDNPVGFSRFSEHTTHIPGQGEVPIMHFHELQSDLLQDVKRYGSMKGSAEKDRQELELLQPKLQNLKATVAQLNEEYRVALNQEAAKGDAYSPIVQRARAKMMEHDRELGKLENRVETLNERLDVRDYRADKDKARYNMPEPFAGMEKSPQVVQQLLIKNAVNAAIRRGNFGATFPGAESAQPQLYANLPNNLKQVAKDLGPGFEVRPITLEAPDQTYSHYGIFWGPEAAARIQKKGMPFRHGGSVERKDDTRRYL